MTLGSPPLCPVCSGPWLYNWTVRHTLTCTLGLAEDATHAADVDRLAYRLTGYERPSTPAELALAAVLGWSAMAGRAPMTSVRSVTRSIVHRVVDGIDPDAPATVLTSSPPVPAGAPWRTWHGQIHELP
jgi:hypothetical protein